jgi:hypothetical protein
MTLFLEVVKSSSDEKHVNECGLSRIGTINESGFLIIEKAEEEISYCFVSSGCFVFS